MPPKNVREEKKKRLVKMICHLYLTTLLFLSSKSISTRATTTWRRQRSRTSSSPRRRQRRRKSPAITFPLLRICRRGKPRLWPASWRADLYRLHQQLALLPHVSLTNTPPLVFFCLSFTLTFYLQCIIYTENGGVQVPALDYG